MIHGIRFSLAVLGLALLLSGQSYDAGDLEQAYERGSLVVDTTGDACHVFDVFLALDAGQRRRGLMFVRELPDTTGMLFVYPEPAMRSMWMKNTYLPLDILFIRGDGIVSSVAAGTVPLSLESIASVEPVTYVLELKAGVAERFGIGAGSRVYF